MLNEKSKADYQPWNHEHFMADRRVRRMLPGVRKSYLMLLHEAFFCSTRPYLPDNDDELWLMADCESREEWDNQSERVREMFSSVEIGGVSLLAQKRVEDDWERILDKRIGISEVRSKAAHARWNKVKQQDANELQTMQNPANDAKQVSKQVSKEVKKESQGSKEKDEQGDTMRAEKQIPISCQQILGVKAETYPDVMNQIKARAITTSNGQVLREFEEWALENQGDDFRGRPVTRFLQSLTNPRAAGERQAADNPVVLNLVRELAYRSDNQVTFDNRAKAGLAKLIEDGNTPDEIVSVFRTDFFPALADDPYQLKFAAKNFVEKADQLVYTARRKKAEKELEASAVSRKVEEMQQTAEADRLARQKAQLAEQALVEDELGD